MAVTQNTYTGNGSTVLFSFTFPYIDTADIKVSLNGTLTTAYTLANATTIQFNTAPGNGAAIRIYRQTSSTLPTAEFFPGSAIRSQDLNQNFQQVLYVSQETENYAASTDSSSVLATATTAINTSNSAITIANNASSVANGIAGTANSALSTANTASNDASLAVAAVNTALLKAGGTMTGDITFASSQSYPRIPQNPRTSTYTLVAADAGRHVSITTGGVTVPSGVFVVGDAITIYNDSGTTQTVTQGGSVTLRQAGTTSTGNRTLSAYGIATLLCVSSNTFVISGAGLT